MDGVLVVLVVVLLLVLVAVLAGVVVVLVLGELVLVDAVLDASGTTRQRRDILDACIYRDGYNPYATSYLDHSDNNAHAT